jgi:hypothetical protein
MSFDKSKVLGAVKLKEETILVEEWKSKEFDGQVVVRELTSRQRDFFESQFVPERKNGKANMADFRAKFLVNCLYTVDGEKMFDKTDVEALAEQPSGIINAIFEVGQRISGMGEKDVDELVKN